MNIFTWTQLAVHSFQVAPQLPKQNFVDLPSEQFTIDEKPVLHWFHNYLLAHGNNYSGKGWVFEKDVMFKSPRHVCLNGIDLQRVTSFKFRAFRSVDIRERVFPLSDPGYFDWNAGRATLAPNPEPSYVAFKADFAAWDKYDPSKTEKQYCFSGSANFNDFHFPHHDGAVDLESL